MGQDMVHDRAKAVSRVIVSNGVFERFAYCNAESSRMVLGLGYGSVGFVAAGRAEVFCLVEYLGGSFEKSLQPGCAYQRSGTANLKIGLQDFVWYGDVAF